MFSADVFSYVNVLDKAADTSWKRETIITNNVANGDTPHYKRQDIDFASVLKKELNHSKYVDLDSKIKNVHMGHLNPEVYTDAQGYSYRMDGNNVDPTVEQAELASEQIKYSTLTDSITQEFSRIGSVIK